MLALGSASSILGGTLTRQLLLADIGVDLTSTVGSLRVRLSDFPALAQVNGSVRLGVNPLRSNHQPDGTFHPILINRLPNHEIIALSAECTHASCAVRTYDASANAHICPCHRSRFRIDGRRISGPAPFSLGAYETSFDGNDTLEIKIPQLGFTVNGCLQSANDGPLLKLEFLARRSITYQVVQKTEIDAEWTPIPFATRPEEPPDRLEFQGNDAFSELYIRQTDAIGFYAVQAMIEEL